MIHSCRIETTKSSGRLWKGSAESDATFRACKRGAVHDGFGVADLLLSWMENTKRACGWSSIQEAGCSKSIAASTNRIADFTIT
jgi:hypothetical protein